MLEGLKTSWEVDKNRRKEDSNLCIWGVVGVVGLVVVLLL